jgi:hypothetical protein
MEAAKKIIDECLCIQIHRCPRDTGHAINFPMDSIIFTAEGNVGDVSFVDPDQMAGCDAQPHWQCGRVQFSTLRGTHEAASIHCAARWRDPVAVRGAHTAMA